MSPTHPDCLRSFGVLSAPGQITVHNPVRLLREMIGSYDLLDAGAYRLYGVGQY